METIKNESRYDNFALTSMLLSIYIFLFYEMGIAPAFAVSILCALTAVLHMKVEMKIFINKILFISFWIAGAIHFACMALSLNLF